jgi:hypothetical protein
VIERGVGGGAFAVGKIGITASLIKPPLQDWTSSAGKSIEAVTAFIETALTENARTPTGVVS